MIDFCLFSQGMSSEFACILETPYTMHPVKKSPIIGNRGQLWTSALSPHLLSPHLDFPKLRGQQEPHLKFSLMFHWFGFRPECTAVSAIQLRMRMRILTRPENSLANLSHQISNIELRIKRCEGIRNANANGFADEIAKCSSSLRKFLANGSLRRNSLALRMRWLGALRFRLGWRAAEFRNTPSTAGNSMTGSERPSPEPLLQKKKRPQPYWGGREFWKRSGSLKCL